MPYTLVPAPRANRRLQGTGGVAPLAPDAEDARASGRESSSGGVSKGNQKEEAPCLFKGPLLLRGPFFVLGDLFFR